MLDTLRQHSSVIPMDMSPKHAETIDASQYHMQSSLPDIPMGAA